MKKKHGNVALLPRNVSLHSVMYLFLYMFCTSALHVAAAYIIVMVRDAMRNEYQ